MADYNSLGVVFVVVSGVLGFVALVILIAASRRRRIIPKDRVLETNYESRNTENRISSAIRMSHVSHFHNWRDKKFVLSKMRCSTS